MALKFSSLALALILTCAPLALAQPPSPSDPSAALAPPEHPATEGQIREYLELTHAVDAAHRAMAESIKASRATSAPYFTSSFWEDLQRAVMQLDFVDAFIPACQKYFSQEDMAATIAFYKSPSGQRLLAAQPFIISAAGGVLKDLGRQAGEQVGRKHKDEIERLKNQSLPSPITLPEQER